jgi:hypothetical protein
MYLAAQNQENLNTRIDEIAEPQDAEGVPEVGQYMICRTPFVRFFIVTATTPKTISVKPVEQSQKYVFDGTGKQIKQALPKAWLYPTTIDAQNENLREVKPIRRSWHKDPLDGQIYIELEKNCDCWVWDKKPIRTQIVY